MAERIKFAAIICLVFVSIASAQSGSERRIKVLPPNEEKAWVDAFKNFKTLDGATVIQVLEHVQKLRPKEFKYFFDPDGSIGYGGPEMEAAIVGASYYIGMKRLSGDQYGVGADGEMKQGKLVLTFRQVPHSAPEALSRGRDAFLQFIDGEYRDICIDAVSKRKVC
jgi:hypothetical protein